MTGNPDPYSFMEARTAAANAARAQAQAEELRENASTTLAEAERAYRIALARKIVEVHAEGCAWTVAQDLARGDKRVADLRYERDVARGVVEAAENAAWRHAANRKDTAALIDWSRRVAPDGQYEQRVAA